MNQLFECADHCMPSSEIRKQKRRCTSVSRLYRFRGDCATAVAAVSCKTFGHVSPFETFRFYDYNPCGFSRIAPTRARMFDRLWGLGAPRCKFILSPVGERVNGLSIEFADQGAERSCLPKRRKRGLRRGKVRSRGRQPSRSLPPRPSISKPISARKVNHIGRKFIWATLAESRFSRTVKRRLKGRSPCYKGWNRVKSSLGVWWQHLAKRASDSGIHPSVAFGTSWLDYFGRSVFWDKVARNRAVESIEDMMVGLPTRSDPGDLDNYLIVCLLLNLERR